MTDYATEYLRRSSGKQEASLEQQMEINAAYIERKGYSRAPGQERFTETMSGKTFDRPVFQQMVSLVTEGQNKFSTVVMYKPNRMGRAKHIEEFFYYEFILSKQGVKIEYALNDECNLEGIAGFMMRGLNYQAAAQYIIDLSNDTTRGLLYNAERGFHFGGEPCYGYDRMLVDMNGNHLGILQLGMHKSDRRDLKVIYVKRTDGLPEFLHENLWQLAIQNGWGASQTAYHLNEMLQNEEGWKPQKAGRSMKRRDGNILQYSGFWAPSTVKDMWKRTTYIGWRTVTIETDNEFHGEERIFKGAHELIVDENNFWTLFQREEKRIWNIPKSQYRAEGVKYPLTRKGRCNHCNEYWMGALTSHDKGKVRYYRDRGSFKKCCPGKDWSIPAQQLEDGVMHIILSEIETGNYQQRIQNFVGEQQPAERKEQVLHEKQHVIEQQQKTHSSLVNLVALAKERPDSKTLLGELDTLEAEEKSLERKLRELEVAIHRCDPIDYSELEKYCTAILESEQEIRKDLERRKEVFQTFVKTFTVNKREKEIEVTFYGIPFLPIVRNEALEEQEREISSIPIPEYFVPLRYRKRRFVLPNEYNHLLQQVPHLQEEREEHIAERQIDPEHVTKSQQLKLF